MRQSINFKLRSNKKELLDGEGIPFKDIERNMFEIDKINHLLGGHNITLKGFKKLLGKRESIHVCEIGCGDGNNLQVIYNWCKKNNIKANFTGIDIKQECISAALHKKDLSTVSNWLVSDYNEVQFQQLPEIIFSSLFCHHFTNDQLVQHMQWMKANCSIGFFINDLQRNVVAYYAIGILTQLFSKSYLVKHDAPLSVARGFHKKEWQLILSEAGIKSGTIQWQWAFRYLVLYKNS